MDKAIVVAEEVGVVVETGTVPVGTLVITSHRRFTLRLGLRWLWVQ